MGVKGLHRYMCQRGIEPEIRERFSIIEEIEMWKSQNNNGRPKILFDVKEMIHIVVQRDNLGQCLGGKYALWMMYFRKFFKQLQEAGAELVFFSAGNKLTDELMVFIPKRGEEYIKYLNVLDGIDDIDGDVMQFTKQKVYDIRAPITMEYNMQKLAQEFGEFHINYERHNQEIAKYIQAHDSSVMAVVTNDNDFMIFDGGFQFWQANDINMRELVGNRMCRTKLRARLELNSEQLQLLSALSGSAYLPYLVLQEFYTKIRKTDIQGNRIPQIAKYIREEVPVLSTVGKKSSDVCFDLTKIAEDIFGAEYSEQDVNAIENGLTQYNLNFKEKECAGSMKFCKSRNMFIYKMYHDDVYLIKDICYIDYRNVTSKSYAELIMPLLCKVQGILYANERNKPEERAFCMKYAHDEPYKVVAEPIEYPSKNVPEIFDLIFKSNETKLDSVRWSLFNWMFDFRPEFTRRAKTFHKKYFTTLVTINYLRQHEVITLDEADAILATENFTRNIRGRQERIDPIRKMSTHYIRVAHLYTKMYVMISQCIIACGLYSLTDFVMFDGLHFHVTLEGITSSPEKKRNALKPIYDYRLYV